MFKIGLGMRDRSPWNRIESVATRLGFELGFRKLILILHRSCVAFWKYDRNIP